MIENTIDLLPYRGVKSTMFTGRPQGEEVRKVLDLDQIDLNDCKVIFTIPEGTTSFNPSFYLGLLFDSIKKLGNEKFLKKYRFDFTKVDKVFEEIIKDDLKDGMRHAINSLNPNEGFESFFED